ncbi:MAG: hypothetical protein HY071_04305 [Chloroflexi bacterium]|nr:hypothetical protein [Chloroflexota bacterium]
MMLPRDRSEPYRLVAIGASDAVGVGSSDPARRSWPALLLTRLPAGSVLVNLGVDGSRTEQARGEQLPGALAAEPSLVTIWLAVNDLADGTDPLSYQRSLAGIVEPLATRTRAAIFIGNVPDIRAVPAFAERDQTSLLALVIAYNDAIVELASRHAGRATVVDLFTGSAPLMTTAGVSADGFHPSDRGYELIAERFARTMRVAGVAIR